MNMREILERIVALREEIRTDHGETWEENFVDTMLSACVDRLGNCPMHRKALHLSLVGERFKTWMNMGWTKWEEYPDWRLALMHEALNGATETAWQAHCHMKRRTKMLTDTDYCNAVRSAEGWAKVYGEDDSRHWAWLAVAWMNRHMWDVSEVAVEHYADFENPEKKDLIDECERFFAEGDSLCEDVEIAIHDGTCDEGFVEEKCGDFLDEAKAVAETLGMSLKRYALWD